MYQAEPKITVKLSDGEVEFKVVFDVFARVDLVQQSLDESANDGLLVVIDDVLEVLVDELHLEVGHVEPRIVVAVVRVSEVEHDLVLLAFAVAV